MNIRAFLLAVVAAACVTVPFPAMAYQTSATVTITWGDSSSSTGPSDRGWFASLGGGSLTQMGDGVNFSSLGGYNHPGYQNSDLAIASDYGPGTDDDCLTPPPGGIDPADVYDTVVLRKYGCRWTSTGGGLPPIFNASAVSGVGPSASASGTLTVTDNALTGTLTMDAPFDYRAFDGAPFGNVWYGISATATLTVQLTGTFTANSWNVTGGTVRLEDSGFQCEQGGFGLIGTPPLPVLCAPSTTAGGHQANGAHLSFGIDPDGAGPGTAITAIEVRDATGTTVVATLSGVIADATLDAAGNITSSSGEFRRGRGASFACPTHVNWDGAAISCGTLIAGPLAIAGAVLSPTEYAAESAGNALTAVAALPASAFTSPNRRNVLTNLIGDAVALIGRGNLVAARDKLVNAIVRTDGCALRGAPDAQGQGQDYIGDCGAQALVYPGLRAALDALAP